VALPSEISFTGFLQYSPRGQNAVSGQSQAYTRAIKNDSFIGNQPAIRYAALRLREEIPKHAALQSCFSGHLVLVPVPRSAPLVTGGLWPSMKLCQAMQVEGIASMVLPLLERQTAVPKSATAAAGQRPGPQQHYDSLAVDPNRPLLSPQHHLVIVDDVVTRGATFFGAYARLSELYSNVPISCFALIRTMSSGDVDALLSPVEGKISFQGGQLHRNP
jgi:hypothetical protein